MRGRSLWKAKTHSEEHKEDDDEFMAALVVSRCTCSLLCVFVRIL